MDNAKNAFLWIVGLMNDNNIAFRITGGLAAIAFGSERPLVDIDIEVQNEDLPLIEQLTRPHVAVPLEAYKDDSWELELLKLRYLDQDVDIAGNRTKLFNTGLNKWEDLVSDITDNSNIEIFGKKTPVEKLESLIAYKTKLGRDVDIEDVKFLRTLKP